MHHLSIMFIKFAFLLTASLIHNLVTAHAYIQHVVVGEHSYPGFRPDEPSYIQSESAVSWTFKAPERGYVNNYSDPDIICHRSATPAASHVRVASGELIKLLWSPWPAHQGPVITYLAACNGPCEMAIKSALVFFKIDEDGLLNSANARGTGYWALDKLIDNNNSWSIIIPQNILPGAYVLRHEAINLDNPDTKAQHFPQCINLEITGSGTQATPPGVVGSELYKPDDPGIAFDIYHINQQPYHIPGPLLTHSIGLDPHQSMNVLKQRKEKEDWNIWKDFAKWIEELKIDRTNCTANCSARKTVYNKTTSLSTMVV
jgi:lytic cellulose monooxygenase (C1-hydroxylating)